MKSQLNNYEEEYSIKRYFCVVIVTLINQLMLYYFNYGVPELLVDYWSKGPTSNPSETYKLQLFRQIKGN